MASRPARPMAEAKRTGRRPGNSTTRDDIIAAARDSFASHGYDGTSMRAVAAAADVDPALVRRFFGSKEDLLVAALAVTFGPDDRLADVVGHDIDTIGDQLAHYMFTVWETPPNRDVLVGMIRSACTNACAARLLRDFLAAQILARLAGAVSDQDAQLRATLAGSQIVGLAVYRYVLEIEPLASLPPEHLQPIVAPTIQRYLTQPLTSPAASRTRRR